MESVKPLPPHTAEYFTPLMISMVAMLLIVVTIVTYHFIVSTRANRRLILQENDERHNAEREEAFGDGGVDEKVLQSIPVLAYSRKEQGSLHLEQSECSVCLSELDEGVMVRLLPNCKHVFHLHCIDEWFQLHSNCPICRSPISLTLTLVSSSTHDQLGNGGSENDDNLVSQLRNGRLLFSYASLKLCNEIKPSPVPPMLNRSLSMDYSYVALKIQESYERSSSSLSASTSSGNEPNSRSNSPGIRRFRHLDRATSNFVKSFSRFQSREGDRDSSILPQ